MKIPFKFLLFIAASSFFMACGSVAQLVSTPIDNIDSMPLKVTPLTEEQYKVWGHLDLVKDTIPGMSVQRTYDEIIKNRKGKTVIVGVIDSGVDITHEDLKNVLWTNPNEIANNDKDDDNNGFIDDINGWNFLGDIVGENMEYVRIMRRLAPKFENKEESAISTTDREDFALYKKVRSEFLKEKQETLANKTQYESILSQITPAHAAVSKKLGKENYTKEELKTLKDDSSLQQEVLMLNQMFSFADNIPKIIKELGEGITYFSGRLNNNFNTDANFRAVLGDNPYDITDTKYGNNQVSGPDPKMEDVKHGTHVSGIIAAQRNNGIGMNGVAQNVQIMVVRAVPDGDEYDKDVALAIRYAVDNGAKVLNTSFGKFYSPNAEWVFDAIKYAAEKDVLIVNAAGNDGIDIDDDGVNVYPNDQTDNVTEISNTFLSVGALTYTYGSGMVADFSNYGKSNVDVFAPGDKIWATTPNNEYEFLQGTSMAAPNVAGIAAMLRSYYPQLSAAQVKQIIMDSGLSSSATVILGGEPDNTRKFSEISKSGKMVNMYNAFLLAEQMARQ
ncbi:MAG: peptidase S8 [Bacteroidetes bacterium HGW-Bacteroidetes-2]|jgi:subtilisin family serine protease|nr:MAG: peptidase S8 [Bacteroidetes bacterium HGW-Bacteroidetes-2]